MPAHTLILPNSSICPQVPLRYCPTEKPGISLPQPPLPLRAVTQAGGCLVPRALPVFIPVPSGYQNMKSEGLVLCSGVSIPMSDTWVPGRAIWLAMSLYTHYKVHDSRKEPPKRGCDRRGRVRKCMALGMGTGLGKADRERSGQGEVRPAQKS